MKKFYKGQGNYKQHTISFLFLSIITVVLAGILLFGTVSAQAASADTLHKYYTSIRIEAGDTLWAIAGAYMTDEYTNIQEYIREVCAINHISEDKIYAGQYIVIPYYAKEI